MRKGSRNTSEENDLFAVAAAEEESDRVSDEHRESNEKINEEFAVVSERIQHQQIHGRVPLFILGAGVSSRVVPLLKHMGSWLHHRLQESTIPVGQEWVLDHAKAIGDNSATRRQAAEFFSALQRPEAPFHGIWSKFSEGFLVRGLDFDSGVERDRFPGLVSDQVKPTTAHEALANMLANSRAHVVSLNFDGLTRKALRNAGHGGLALHSNEQVRRYFAADTIKFIPAVIKVRGDVFYATCENGSCPLSYTEYPLDRLMFENPKSDSTASETGTEPTSPLLCPICAAASLRLQFSFPGYREKEEVADPMLWTTRRYVGSRLSAIVILGLSGRWDRYLLRFLFDLARERNLLIADVKPHGESGGVIDNFRASYYPSVPRMVEPKVGAGPVFVRIPATADSFVPAVKEWLNIK